MTELPPIPPIMDDFTAELVRASAEVVEDTVRRVGSSDPWFAARLKEHAMALRSRLEEWEQARP